MIKFRDFTNGIFWSKINTSSKQAKQIAEEKAKTIRKTDYEERSNGDEDLQYWQEGEYDDDVLLLLHDA